jgi:hypothetical protein
MSRQLSLIPTYMLKRVAGMFPEDLTRCALGARGRRAIQSLRDYLTRPPVSAKVFVVGEFHYLDEDMGDGYYVKCTQGLTEQFIDEESELMTVAQHIRIMTRTVELLKAAQDVAGHSLSMAFHDEIDTLIKEFEHVPT